VIEPILCSTILDVFLVILFYQTATTLPAIAYVSEKKDGFRCQILIVLFQRGADCLSVSIVQCRKTVSEMFDDIVKVARYTFHHRGTGT
jgi:hypothetical protein